MNALTHPMLVHLPMAMSIFLPLLAIAGLVIARKNQDNRQIWLVISGLLIVTSIATLLAASAGESSEEMVEKVVSESLIESHEDAASIFSALLYLTTAASVILIFLNDTLKKYFQYGVLGLSILVMITGIRAGKLGGELVYKHNAAAVFANQNSMDFGTEKGADKQTNQAETKGFWGGGNKDHDDDDDDD